MAPVLIGEWKQKKVFARGVSHKGHAERHQLMMNVVHKVHAEFSPSAELADVLTSQVDALFLKRSNSQ
jgi:hypothetical protein